MTTPLNFSDIIRRERGPTQQVKWRPKPDHYMRAFSVGPKADPGPPDAKGHDGTPCLCGGTRVIQYNGRNRCRRCGRKVSP